MVMSAASGMLGHPSDFGSHTHDRRDEAPKPSYVIPSKIIVDTQNAIELYRSGQKLWMGCDLERIEYELANCRTIPSFTIRRIDGSTISIKNPMFGVANPIWKPYVKFQHYWYLFKQGPENTSLGSASPHPFSYYSYFIDWENRTYIDFIEGEHTCLGWRFDEAKKRWGQSQSYDWLEDTLGMLRGSRKMTKVLCFGLGNMTPGSHYGTAAEFDQEAILRDHEASLNQHAVALTIAAALRSTDDLEIFAQDPGYSQKSKALLNDEGFTVIGEHGAGGFSKIDYDSVVFFCYPAAPVRQIIADVGRPALIIGNGDKHILNEDQAFPFPFDAESPRTREMWKEYTRYDFEIMEQDEQTLTGLAGLNIYVRNEIRRGDRLKIISENGNGIEMPSRTM